MKKYPAQKPDDIVMESPSLAITNATAASSRPGCEPMLIRSTSQPSLEDGTFTDGLPEHWSATVRRNWWGTWSAAGTYSGPEIGEPRELVSGWCWTRAQAIEQVGYWIEDAACLDRTWWLSSAELQADELAAYNEDLVRHVEHQGNQELEAAETAAQREDADRTADQLLTAITRESFLANTPLEVQFPDAGYGPQDFPDDHTVDAEDRFAEHLRTHPDLRALPKWQRFYIGLDDEEARRREDEAWVAEETAAAFDTHENDLAMASAGGLPGRPSMVCADPDAPPLTPALRFRVWRQPYGQVDHVSESADDMFCVQTATLAEAVQVERLLEAYDGAQDRDGDHDIDSWDGTTWRPGLDTVDAATAQEFLQSVHDLDDDPGNAGDGNGRRAGR